MGSDIVDDFFLAQVTSANPNEYSEMQVLCQYTLLYELSFPTWSGLHRHAHFLPLDPYSQTLLCAHVPIQSMAAES